MKRIYLLLAAAVLCLGAETVFAQQLGGAVNATAIVDGADNFTIDFGFYVRPIQTFSIGDWVWEDSNKNGIQDDGELGIPGVRVELWQGDEPISTTTTNDSQDRKKGNYIFDGLTNGTYEVKIPMDQPALKDMINTTPNAGADDIDSDGIPAP